jgi:dTDP-glucose 4,6-dehydratase
MKVLVTGGDGFIGSNFILHTLKNFPKFEIINLDAGFYGSNKLSLDAILNYNNYEFVKGNINDSMIVDDLVSKCDAVINFAAESFVDRSIADAKPFLRSNIDGVFTILESIKKYKKKFLQISTDEVFGSLDTESASETFQYNPSSPYAATKASAEMLVNSYHITYDCDTVITRCTNNYGPRQFNEKLIPKTIGLSNENKKIPVYGNGTSIRDWIHVEDHCKAIMLVLEKGISGESYNISSSNEVNNLTLVKKILEFLNKSNENIQFVENRAGEDTRYSLDSTKIYEELGWKPKINFDEGLEKTIQWYISNKDWWK